MLHLLEDVPGRDDQDSFSAAALDQLAEDHPDLERLAQADGVRDQDARADVATVQRLGNRDPLVVEAVGEHARGDAEPGVIEGCRRFAESGLEP